MTSNEFTHAFNELEHKLVGFALKLTQNQDRAQDLLQETAMRAFRHRDKYKTGTNFKAWISTIMRNTFINNYRRQKRRQEVSESVDNLAYAIENKNALPNHGEMNLRLEELYSMFDQIGELYSVPFLMYFRGYEYKEIAEILNVPLGTIKSRIFIARKKMKELIQHKN